MQSNKNNFYLLFHYHMISLSIKQLSFVWNFAFWIQLWILSARTNKHFFCHLFKSNINKMTLFQNQFVVDDVSKIIKEGIESTIGGNAYQHDKVNNWTGAVVENCLSVLTKQQKPYKYIGKWLSRWVMQKIFWKVRSLFLIAANFRSAS